MRSTILLASFTLLLPACPADPEVFVDAAPEPPDAEPSCTPPTGTGTTHGTNLADDETWTAAASPHVLMYDVSVYASITIEACAVVQIGAGKTITLYPGGAIVAAGEPGLPVTFERLEATAWGSIHAVGGDVSLTHTILDGGGQPLATMPVYAGAIHVQTGSLHVDDVEIADSASQGVYLNGSVGFDATSQDLRVHGAASFPIHSFARVIGSIPTGTYTGNGRDEIAIAGTGGPVLDDQTLHDRGVPYHVGSGQDGGRMDVSAVTGVATLTIEAGVTVRFPAGGTLNIDPTAGTEPAHGALIAVGTAGNPIVFTSDSATPAAGDWLGLGFGRAVDPSTVVQHVRVEFAGGAGTGSNSCPYPGRIGQNDAAIRIFGTTGPATQFITETEIVSSARDGIDRGWRDDVTTDFLATNTFTLVAECDQSVPRTFNGVCPASPDCP